MKNNIKRDIIFIIVCAIMAFCGYYVNTYPVICVISGYFCGIVIALTQNSEILDFIKKKLN